MMSFMFKCSIIYSLQPRYTSHQNKNPSSITFSFFINQSSRLVREHAESVLKTERETWAREKTESQQALRTAQIELLRLKEELSKEAVTRAPVSGNEPVTEEITWPRAKVGVYLKLKKKGSLYLS